MIAPAANFRLCLHGTGLALSREGGPGLAVDQLMTGRLMTGRPLAEVERLLPALFGLCRSVQEAALALTLGGATPDRGALIRDMIRDHLARLYLHLPRALDLAPRPLPQNWARGGAGLRQAVFGAEGLPQAAAFDPWLRAQASPVAQLLARVDGLFAPGEAAGDLPFLDPEAPFDPRPVENSLIARHAFHPLLSQVIGSRGRGPLAHLTARLIDLDALSRGQLPDLRRLADGTALVPCSRGLCALNIRATDGVVTDFRRRTPTDHLLMPGGLLECALARLPAARAGLAPLLTDILDPCLPVILTPPAPEIRNAGIQTEVRHA